MELVKKFLNSYSTVRTYWYSKICKNCIGRGYTL